MRLFLFDLDGTLVRTGGAGLRALDAAFRDSFGVEHATAEYKLDGMTDPLIVRDLIESIEQDRQPHGSVYDGRAALEMILATYESHRRGGPVEMPLKNRKHPLTLL